MITQKTIDESKQGQVTLLNQNAPVSKKVYIESYGCQMNFSDSEIVASILYEAGYGTTSDLHAADLILINTCSIREKAEQTVRNRLQQFHAIKKKNAGVKIGVLGCMAERLKEKFLEEEKLVDLVVGPDAYRDLPSLLEETEDGKKAVNVILSKEETYADISPVRLNTNGVSAFISIMRGCDNMCTFCVVPFTRGRERSRDPESILKEVEDLVHQGYKEVTLLGQNVDSYLWFGGGPKKNFYKLSPEEQSKAVNFARLLAMVASVSPKLRVRFSTSHPKDITRDVIETMAKYPNICKYIHLPLQSGSSRILEMMNRGYSKEWYLNKIDEIKSVIPDCAISTDIIAGFCSETEQDHEETLEVMEKVKFHYAYMFKYSERPNTPAQKKFKDDVPDEIKTRRLNEIIALQQQHSLLRNQEVIGQVFEVLIEGVSKRSPEQYSGRNSQNTVIVFDKKPGLKPGDYINVKVKECTSATLIGEIVE